MTTNHISHIVTLQSVIYVNINKNSKKELTLILLMTTKMLSVNGNKAEIKKKFETIKNEKTENRKRNEFKLVVSIIHKSKRAYSSNTTRLPLLLFLQLFLLLLELAKIKLYFIGQPLVSCQHICHMQRITHTHSRHSMAYILCRCAVKKLPTHTHTR